MSENPMKQLLHCEEALFQASEDLKVMGNAVEGIPTSNGNLFSLIVSSEDTFVKNGE